MYGMVNKSIEEMVVSAHGEETWERIKEKAGVDVEVFISSEGYSDELTYSLVFAASDVLGVPAGEILEAFGVHWIVNTAQKGYGDMMAAGGSTLREFLLNLPQFHSRVSMIFPHLRPPEFACSDIQERSVRLHYRSTREGLAPFVVGLLKGLSQLYKTPIQIEHAVRRADGSSRDEFVVEWR
jgi:hypothetical protein